MLPNLLRPNKLEDVVGNSDIVSDLNKKIVSHSIPHFIILHGEIGTGKTTLAKIIASSLYKSDTNNKPEEINASDKNGIEFIREFIENCKYKSINQKYKVYIFDEAHQLSNASQNCLLTFLESLPQHVYIMFCTSQYTKLIPAVRRRALSLNLKLLKNDEIRHLVDLSLTKLKGTQYLENTELISKINEFVDLCIVNSIKSPGLVIQALEKYLGGMDVEQAVETNDNTLEFCRLLFKGNWKGLSEILKKSDSYNTLKYASLGYLKKVLLDSPNNDTRIAKMIKLLIECSDNPLDFIATVSLCCDKVSK